MEGRFMEVGGRKSRLNEAGGGLEEIFFEGLQIGDVLVLETESGSSYKLMVRDNHDSIQVDVQRDNEDRSVIGDDQTSWEDVSPDTLFELKGSCERILTGTSTGLRAIGGTEGHFVLGERAWLTTEIDGKDKTLITSRLASINLTPAP